MVLEQVACSRDYIKSYVERVVGDIFGDNVERFEFTGSFAGKSWTPFRPGSDVDVIVWLRDARKGSRDLSTVERTNPKLLNVCGHKIHFLIYPSTLTYSAMTTTHSSNPQTVKALIEDEFELERLFKLQDSLIEHKFPSNHIAIHEYLISCAGDIYREMTHKTPYFRYIDEKWRALMKYCYRLGGLTKGDYEELAMLMREPYYKPRRDEYLRNLERLKAETIKARIDEKRKSVMLAALNMIEGLIRWFESLDPYKYPKAEMDALTDAIANYFPEQFYE
jgi:hypothetical protein